MQIRRMGNTGLKVSNICLGTMTFGHQCDESTSFAIMNKAAEHGVSFIDTADVYPVPPAPETWGRTEEIVGKWLQGRREQFVLATKCRIRWAKSNSVASSCCELSRRSIAVWPPRLSRPVKASTAIVSEHS